MIKTRRVILATILGLAAGFFCILGGMFLGREFNTATLFMILFHRTLIGFVIGISALRMQWALHGILVGFIVGLPYYPLAFVEGGGLAYSIMSPIWGFVIELFTSVIFKETMARSKP